MRFATAGNDPTTMTYKAGEGGGAAQRPFGGERKVQSRAPGSVKSRTVRLTMICAAMLFSFCFGLIVHAAFGGDEVGASAVQEKREVIVTFGDSLWAIASRHAPDGQDIRLYIEKIKKANGLSSGALKAGQKLVLP